MVRKIEHTVMNNIDKQISKLPYVYAKVEIVMQDKTIICEYQKDKVVTGFRGVNNADN